jgi:hypothetical protein
VGEGTGYERSDSVRTYAEGTTQVSSAAAQLKIRDDDPYTDGDSNASNGVPAAVRYGETSLEAGSRSALTASKVHAADL